MSLANEKDRRIGWYYAPAFLLFWSILFFAVVLPLFFHLPKGLTIEGEHENPEKFIAERAARILFDFDMIGPKVTGSHANENLTVQLLKNEVEKIRHVMHHDLFNMEVDIQVVSGAYALWPTLNMYQALQNFVVKLGSKNSTSQNYLLINSHFDSKPGSPGSGDDGAMVVIMLEILRVLATNRQTFKHPIVFLFNGAEENRLQASHGFITQHKWAENCRALINLDSAGSGHREILFQSGPNHPWLMNYYNKHSIRPYATSLAEELFQANVIPSDTDFRIFRDYGHVPGLDFAHSYNGYVYHTKFDKFDVIPRGTLQSTGENILSLTKALANAPEMENTKAYSAGHSVFYDFLGLFFITYTETVAQIMNTCVCVIVIVAVGISLWCMAAISYISIGNILKIYAVILVLHIVGLVLALGLPIGMAVIFDNGNRSMTWFSSKWLVLGLYVCPTLFGLTLPSLLYLNFNRNDKLCSNFKIQIIQHAHALVLATLCIVTTFMGIRSAYLLFISIFFYSISLILNLVTTLHNRGNFWCILIILGQILPFLYFSYIFYALVSSLMPMMGRFGTSLNPDILIGGIVAFATILAMGFLMPIWNMFRRSKLLLLSLLLVTFVFSMIALTPVGFPYRPKTNVARIHFLNVRRVFYEYDSSVSLNESGYYFDFQDRRIHLPIEDTIDLRDIRAVAEDCDNYMMCGFPLFNHRMVKTRKKGKWLPTKEPAELPGTPKLTLLKKMFNNNNNTAHFEFELSGPPYMSIFLMPMKGVTIYDWSFLKELLMEPKKFELPYHICLTYGKYLTPLKFFIDFKLDNKKIDQPLFELGISGHYVSFEYPRDKNAQDFIKQFPDFVFIMEWPSSYERYIF